jgi:hypothetical protein
MEQPQYLLPAVVGDGTLEPPPAVSNSFSVPSPAPITITRPSETTPVQFLRFEATRILELRTRTLSILGILKLFQPWISSSIFQSLIQWLMWIGPPCTIGDSFRTFLLSNQCSILNHSGPFNLFLANTYKRSLLGYPPLTIALLHINHRLHHHTLYPPHSF